MCHTPSQATDRLHLLSLQELTLQQPFFRFVVNHADDVRDPAVDIFERASRHGHRVETGLELIIFLRFQRRPSANHFIKYSPDPFGNLRWVELLRRFARWIFSEQIHDLGVGHLVSVRAIFPHTDQINPVRGVLENGLKPRLTLLEFFLRPHSFGDVPDCTLNSRPPAKLDQ